ncbi:Esterase [Verticillium dahliae VDG2]|nr:Esterase [Verticillium dahliae VDG2]
MPFRIIIVGAGIAGLCAAIGLAQQGHDVTILESAKELTPIGVGIHIPPNAALVLKHFGILERMTDDAIHPTKFVFRRWNDNKVIATVQAGKQQQGTPPYWSMRRSHYQRHLYDAMIEAGAKLRLNARVETVNEQEPSVALLGGEVLTADLVVLSDGIKSKLRNDIIPEEDTSMNLNPLSAFRAYVHHDDLMSDPITAPIFKEIATNVWAGYNRHVIIYPCAGGMYTLGATHPANHNEIGDQAMEWSRAATVSQAEEEYQEWNPIVKRILHHTKEVGKWRLAEVPRLPRWASKSGRVVLMGDNAHAMLQFLAQGAAMATEDAGSLSVAVSRAKSAEDLPRVLKAYERARKWRCEAVSAQARRNGDMIHMPDGEEQENRDRKMSQLAETGVWKADTGPMFDAEFRNFLYNHNTKMVLDSAT